jgi:mannose-1-phosphate guanylyltransferase/mannose-6-phosphate isomerase
MALCVAQRDPQGILACMPADHVIGGGTAFQETVSNAAATAEAGWIVILGVAPSYPATSFGYIQPGKALDGGGARKVARFVEKPGEAQAKDYVRNGYLWNSGMVVARADVLLHALERHAPDVLGLCRQALDRASEDLGAIVLDQASFSSARSIAFDYAVLEQHDRIAVVEFEGNWSDLGSWPETAKLYPADENDNRSVGEVRLKDCKMSFVHGQGRLVVGIGLRNVAIVDTTDALLVADLSKIDGLKDAVGEMSQLEQPEAISHRRVYRPWGHYEPVDRGEKYQVKRITVKPGGVLSLQYHHRRAEHWVVVKGQALVTCGDKQFLMYENQSTYIPQGAIHRLENPGSDPLELIEVQSGSYLGEDDIVRVSDYYGRAQGDRDS